MITASSFSAKAGNFLCCLTALLFLSSAVNAQYEERRFQAGSGLPGVDVSGRSLKNSRARAVHSDNVEDEGGTADLIRRDPFLAYQLGRNLNFREFRLSHGVMGVKTGDLSLGVSNLGGPMPDGTTAKITRNNHLSCASCHNLPQGNPGGGTNFHKDSGFGRQAPHYYGAGLVEMITLQIRADLLSQIDTDNSGWVSRAEAVAAPTELFVEPGTSPKISFGSPKLSGGTTGSPSFNNIIRVWYVDQDGRHVPESTDIDGVASFGYNFSVMVWGWGQGVGRSALNPTNRAFLWDPFNAHSGLESFDPSTVDDPDGDGVSEPTLSGAVQFPATHRAPDPGEEMDPLGFSRDDPDGDGIMNEISEGDLDYGEWFMLHLPQPSYAGSRASYGQGAQLLRGLGCTACHTPDWQLNAESATFDGDRRLFELAVGWSSSNSRLEGKLRDLSTTDSNGEITPKRRRHRVSGIFSDFRHHEMGEGFAEVDFGGNINTTWRTPPLWGVGTGFPWGHDGMSLTLEDVILRHGGEAQASRDAFAAASEAERATLLNFLRKCCLYDIETLPADIDGDGAISENHMVAGMDTGVERFNAEWLFRTPLKIQGSFQNTDGVFVRSNAGVNIPEAYGELLRFRRDQDGDGWPDIMDNCPTTEGFKDGCSN